MGERKTWKGKEREGKEKSIEEIGTWGTRRKKRFSPEWGTGDLIYKTLVLLF